MNNAANEESIAFDLGRFLPYRVNVLADLLSRSLALTYQERFGITVPEWRVLATLGAESPLSASEVGNRTHMEKARISRTLSRLLETGLVSRQTASHDNRVAVLRLTRRGMDLYRRIVPVVLEWEARLLEGLSAEERAQLDGLLGRLQGRLLELREGT